MRVGFFRRRSAPVARERLQILLEFERRVGAPDLVAVLRDEIMAAIAKHVTLDPEKVQVKIDRGKNVSNLEIDVEVPNSHVNAPPTLGEITRDQSH
jgi:cell division topological specificity factor